MRNEKLRAMNRRLRHLRRTNLCVIRYAFKSLVCIVRGDTDNLNWVRVNELVSSSSIKDLPLTAFEYEYCITYAKLIRKALLQTNEFSNKLQFETVELFGLYEKNFEFNQDKVFIFIAETCGFTVENCCKNKIYELTSLY